MNAGTSLLPSTVLPFSSFRHASVLPSTASTLRIASVQPPTFVRFLTFLDCGFVTFVFFTLRCHLFFILRCHLFFFINSCAFSYYLSFLLPNQVSGRNVFNSTALCSTICRSLNYVNTFRFRSMPELLLCCALQC